MAELLDAQILRRLLDAAWQPPDPQTWARFDTQTGRAAVGAAFFLLDVASGQDVEAFVLHDGERLLQHLHRRTDRMQVEQRGRVRGQVLWPSTFKARYAEDYDATRFVCREVRNEYDTPENQAIRYVIHGIEQCLENVAPVVQAGLCYLGPEERTQAPGTGRQVQGTLRRTLDRLDNLDAAIHRFQRNIYLRSVTLPDRLDDEHLRRVDAAKLPEYRVVLQLYHAYRRLCRAPSIDALQREVTKTARRVLPLPAGTGEVAMRWMALAGDLLRHQIAGTL